MGCRREGGKVAREDKGIRYGRGKGECVGGKASRDLGGNG